MPPPDPQQIIRGFSTSSFPGDTPAPRKLRRPSSRRRRRQSAQASTSTSTGAASTSATVSAAFDGAVAAATSAVSTVASSVLPKRSSSSAINERSLLIDEVFDANTTALRAASVKFTTGGGHASSSTSPGSLSSFSATHSTDDDSDAWTHVHDIRIDPYRLRVESESTLPREIHPHITVPEADQIWKFNYNEAAIYLEEGENNEKLLYHPRCNQSLSSYKYVHNQIFYVLDLLAALTLLALTLCEPPTSPSFLMDKSILLSIELLCLTIISIECWMKLRWMGFRSFLTHIRTVIKVTCTIIMILDAVMALFTNRSDFRVVRALRPVFLIDNHFCYSIRRTLRHTLQSLRPIFDIILILFMIITVFSLLGFYLFKDYPNNKYFTSFGETFSNMFVVISNGNFPDIMMYVFSQHQTSAIFFVIYLIIQIYFILNMMLAVSYEKYSSVEREKFRRLFLHRRLCCRHAFNLLTSDEHPDSVIFKHFEGVVKIIKPGISKLRCYLMFKLCDTTRTGSLSLDQFYRIYDALELNWSQEYPELRWHHRITNSTVRNFFELTSKIARSSAFENIIDYIIISSLIFEVVYCSTSFPGLEKYTNILYTFFISTYAIESLMKICTYGLVDYIAVGWNAYDFLVAGVSLIGFYVQPFGYSFGYFYILRTFRILRLFQKTQRYQHIMGPFVFILLRQMTHFCVIVFVVLYSFSIIGMELFALVDIQNPPPIDLHNVSMDDMYRMHNFADFPSSFLLLLILSFTYMWSFVMDRYARLVSCWSRVYFIVFYVISTVVMKIVVSSILEAFLFVMKCKRRLADIQEQTRITRDIKLTESELISLGLAVKQHPLNGTLASGPARRQYKYAKAIFRGKKLRTKFSFSCKMYDKEIKEWIEEEEASDKLLEQAAKRRRAYSCKV